MTDDPLAAALGVTWFVLVAASLAAGAYASWRLSRTRGAADRASAEALRAQMVELHMRAMLARIKAAMIQGRTNDR